jgi:large repetitive protein
MVAGGLFVTPNWSPRLADRLGSVRTDFGVAEHWPRDLAPVMYPHLPNPFWREVPGEVPPEVPPEGPPPEVPADMATSADAGTPGDFQPSGAITPTSLEDMASVTANPTTPWTEGQYMVLDDEVTECYWDGTAWAPGRASASSSVPTISTIAPVTGSLAGGDDIVISGTNFVAGMTAAVGGNPVTGTGYIDPTRFEGTSPPGAPGAADVTVTTPDGTATLSDGYTYEVDITVTSVTPSTGSMGTGVTITGSGFVGLDPATSVRFGPNPATGVVWDIPTQFTCLAPEGTGTVDVTVIGPTGNGNLPDAFTYEDSPGPDAPDPELISITPNTGPDEGGTPFTISGVGMLRTIGAVFQPTGGTSVPVEDYTVVDDSTVTGTTPNMILGQRKKTMMADLIVDHQDAGLLTMVNAFKFAMNIVASEGSSDPDVQEVAQTIQENAETIGEAAENIGEAAQTLAGPSQADGGTGTTPEASSGSEGTTAAPATGQEPDMTEYEMDQMWGIGTEGGPEA